MSSPALPTRHRDVTTTDLWKAVALTLIFVDHLGHYLVRDADILRAVGRSAVPIWFFFIGFGNTRSVPVRWLVIGLALTVVDTLWVGSLAKSQLNILFNFALIRLCLPWIEAQFTHTRAHLAAFVIAMIALIPLANLGVEYGTEGILFALIGYAHRQFLTHGEAEWALRRNVIAGVSVLAFVIVEGFDYNFAPIMQAIMLIGTALVMVPLLRFERASLVPQPAGAVGTVLRLCGRYSLEIYAAQIVLLAAIGGVWSPPEQDDDG